MTPYTLFYVSACKRFWGCGGPIAATLEQAAQEYVIKETEDVPAGVGFAVPMLTFDNGVTISQTTAILTVLGDQHDLADTTVTQKMQVKQYLRDLDDIVAETDTGNIAEKPERADKWFSLLAGRLGNGYFVGDSLSVVDFYAFFVLLWVAKNGVSIEKYTVLAKFRAMVGETCAMKKLAATGVGFLP